ncbi:MAG: hypothetical protein M0Z77_01445 [Thermoplasmatales archaeon]|jgi:hypothetical protein|nr:hypothetical protein [Candidatus Thermoplasmatota archaeon]MCL6002838.1 hypothetical protein [Candidatus Thermoplasmatota archaeon]MDA8054300.1 hypothetical protein [Thermoplasmatales archaeon]
MIIPSVTLRRKKILEAEALEKYESGPLWLVDEDYKNGRELNFKKYDDLSGVYELYLDAEISQVDDIADSITGGATMVTVSEAMEREKLRKALFYTDSLILYVKNNNEVVNYFLANGGSKVYSDSILFDDSAVEYTSKLNCDRCNIITPIGGFNGRRDKEASALP